MVIKGHVCDGVVVLDEKVKLPDGATVFISLEPFDESQSPYRRYRGSSYQYEAPFSPATPESDWDAFR